ncbi:hypothetical protein GCM10023149_28450 [Mucilaginibacter gynuensis]|uniref:Uncharacterized protein n=1 Tax=Mucilaginibacter gynuensis TaxID=1302236 RepID=A0ABP8GK97_9SPHI
MIEDRLISLFPDMHVKVLQENARFSVRGSIEGLAVHYLFESVGETKEVDRQYIQQFSTWLMGNKASKGYLLHTHPVKKKIRDLALHAGIELIHQDNFYAEDFTIIPKVPIKYFHPSLRTAEITEKVYYNNAMALQPPTRLTTRLKDVGLISLDGGASQMLQSEFIVNKYFELQPDVIAFENLDLKDERVFTKKNNAWLLTDLVIAFKWRKPAYLIYLNAADLYPYRNQWKSKPMSPDFRVKQLTLPPKEEWIMIGNPHKMPVRTNLLLEGIYELPENMADWIPQHLSYNNDDDDELVFYR